MGKVVMTNYGRSRYYRVEDVDFRKPAEVTLDNKGTTLLDYYRIKYNMSIKNLKQPLLRVEDRKRKVEEGPVLLVPEFCLLTGIPDTFDEFRRKKVSEATIKNPHDKLKEI